MSAAVSALARPNPRRSPAVTAEPAAGSRTRRMAENRDIPKAAAPRRQSSGTILKPCSIVRTRSGRIMHARVRPPARIENPIPSQILKNALPNKPNTIDGTPARTSRLRLVHAATRLPTGMISARKIAVARPSGVAATIAIVTIRAVDTRMGAIPPLRPAPAGASTMNDQSSPDIPRKTTSRMTQNANTQRIKAPE